MPDTSRRMHRLNDQIRDELAELLRNARDDRLHGIISITGVETSPDLSTSRIFISVLGDEKQAQATFAHIQRAKSFFRRELARRLNLKRTPELDFRLDRTMAAGARIEELLKSIKDEMSEARE